MASSHVGRNDGAKCYSMSGSDQHAKQSGILHWFYFIFDNLDFSSYYACCSYTVSMEESGALLMLDKNSPLWKYLSEGQRGLVSESLFLLEDIKLHPDTRLTDYSYIVFPISKAYEGFLKQLFWDRHYISENQYYSDHFRIGKALSPNLVYHLRDKSVYFKIKERSGEILANKLWEIWKKGRNLIIHYYPHNFKAISLQEAEDMVYDFLRTMEEAIYECKGK